MESGGKMNADVDNTTQKQKAHHRVMARLRGYFLAGILVTAPISITLYSTWVFLNWVDSLVTPHIEALFRISMPFTVPGLGLVVAVTFFILVGWLAKNVLGRLIIRMSEFVVNRVPVVKTIHAAIKQIFETLMTDQSKAFREVVMFEYPRAGSWTLGFVTGVTKGEVQSLTEDEVVNVYIPTTPNPTSGFLLFLPRKDLMVMNMTVEDGIKMIVSGGLIMPEERPGPVVGPAIKN